MDTKKALIGIIIVIVVIIIATIAFTNNSGNNQGTNIEVISNTTLANGENLTVSLTDASGQPIVGKQVDVTLVAVNGDTNTLNLITNDKGQATFKLEGVSEGDYTVNCGFAGDAQNPPADLSVQFVVNDNAV